MSGLSENRIVYITRHSCKLSARGSQLRQLRANGKQFRVELQWLEMAQNLRVLSDAIEKHAADKDMIPATRAQTTAQSSASVITSPPLARLSERCGDEGFKRSHFFLHLSHAHGGIQCIGSASLCLLGRVFGAG